MRILAFSDLHNSAAHAADLVTASVDADLVIGAGDFCNYHEGLAEGMALLNGLAAPLVVVAGNHESTDNLRAAVPLGVTVLHGESLTFGGVTLFGVGHGVPVTPFGDWSCDLNEAEATVLLDRCSRVDVLITHAPPFGLGDKTSAGVSVGSTAIRAAIERVQPKLALCGHIHDSWGIEGDIGDTRVVNMGPGVRWFEVSP